MIAIIMNAATSERARSKDFDRGIAASGGSMTPSFLYSTTSEMMFLVFLYPFADIRLAEKSSGINGCFRILTMRQIGHGVGPLSGGSATLSVTDKSRQRLGDGRQHVCGRKVPVNVALQSESQAMHPTTRRQKFDHQRGIKDVTSQ
jgi:hypothetical protein